MRLLASKTLVVFWALIGSLLLLPLESQAMPSFARQTGMNCNSCHIGTDNVPNFTRTGRLFAMRGYTRPVVRERLRHEGDTVEDATQYGGDYLALNWNDFFAARLISEFVQGGKANDAAGTKLDTTSRPLARMAFFYTGPITDWLGLWTEIGYLGNNSLNSVTTGSTGPTGLNLYAFDEYRLSTGMDLGPGTFIGMSFGNENPNVVSQWVFPAGLPDMWGNGQGGTGRFKELATLSFHGLFDDRYWAQVAFVSGDDNNNWSNGSNIYTAFGYDMFRQTRNDLWFVLETYSGKDTVSQMTQQKNSYICPGTCPAGVVDSTLSITNQIGGTNGIILGAPVEKVKDFKSYKLRVEHSVADLGSHSWVASAVYHWKKENYVSGANAERSILGGYLRYFYQRTYGFYTTVWKDINYDYTNSAGVKRGTYQKPNFSITGLWNPAMNVSVHLTFNPRVQNRVFEDDRANYLGNGRTYNLGVEYNF
jgi:hypothetical protein